MNREEKIKQINKKRLMVNIIDMPGTMMFGLGLYGKFAVNGDAFVSWLNDGRIVDFLLVAGALIMAWGAYKTFMLGKEKACLEREEGL